MGQEQCEIAIGIDFGTTFSAVSICVNGRCTAVNFPGEGAQVPTTVFYDEEGQVFVGRKALRHAVKNPACLFSHFKRGLLDDPHQARDGAPTPFQLATDYLRELWKQLVTVVSDVANYVPELRGTRPPGGQRIYLANPSNCGFDKRRTYQQLAAEVGNGFRIDGQIDEPIAASFHFRQQCAARIRHADILAVSDIGGGTTDNTFHRSNRGVLDTIVGARGESKLGGVDFTGALFQLLCDRVGMRVGSCFEPNRGFSLTAPGVSPAQRLSAAALWEHAEDVKLQLSTFDSATVYVDAGKGGLKEVIVTRDEFQQLTEPLFRRYEETLVKSIDGSGLKWSDVQHVTLVGGSSLLPTLRERVARVVGRDVNDIYVSNDSAQLVAAGAAYQAFTQEETNRHLANGLGLRLRAAKNGSAHRNRLFFAPGQIIPVAGATVETLGQFVESSGGATAICLNLVEAKPGVTTDGANGDCGFLDDDQCLVVDELRLQFELPPGEHEARVLCAIDPANQARLTVGFPNLPHVESQSCRIGQAIAAGDRHPEPSLAAAILLDVSSSMEGDKLDEAGQATLAFSEILAAGGAVVGLVAFGEQVQQLADFTGDTNVLAAAVQNAQAYGGTPMAEALTLARQMFQRQADGSRQFAVLVTDGEANSPEEAQRAADALKADGVTLVCIGIGDDVCEHFLLQIASSPELYFFAKVPNELVGVFSNIAQLYLNSEA